MNSTIVATTNKPIKLHSPLVITVSSVLDAIIQNGYVIEKTLQPVLQNKRLGSRDRKFIISNIYDIIRNYFFYDKILSEKNDEDLDWHQQMVLLNLVNQKITILNPELFLPDADEWISSWKQLLAENDFSIATKNGFSEWFWAVGQEDYGSNWTKIAKGLNQPAPIYIRANLLKTNPSKLAAALAKDNIETSEIPGTNALLLPNRDNIRNHSLNRKGHFEMQDLASQSIGQYAQINKNQLVIDVCAGAGGKSLQIASLLNNTGKVIATDIYPSRLKQLKSRALKANASNIEIIEIQELESYKGKADRVLLDVPCSGSGTIRRQPEIKVHLTPEKVNEYIETQQLILEQYQSLLKPGGKIIYSTCSIFKSESEDQVKHFLANHPQFSLLGEKRFVPPTHNSDGFYVAVLELEK